MRPQLIKDDLRYLIFSELYVKFDEPKTRRRAFSILESAIGCFDKHGFEHVTLTMIARESGVTRQLLAHYFEGLSEIRNLAIKYIRLIGQSVVVAEVKDDKRPDHILKSYVEAHGKWALRFPAHVRVWHGFLSSSAKNEKDRRLNMSAVETGTNRLRELIDAGKALGVFTTPDAHKSARLIQTIMLGWLISAITEDEGPAFENLSHDVVAECLRLAGTKSI